MEAIWYAVSGGGGLVIIGCIGKALGCCGKSYSSHEDRVRAGDDRMRAEAGRDCVSRANAMLDYQGPSGHKVYIGRGMTAKDYGDVCRMR